MTTREYYLRRGVSPDISVNDIWKRVHELVRKEYNIINFLRGDMTLLYYCLVTYDNLLVYKRRGC